MTDWVNVQHLGPLVTRDIPINYDRIFVVKGTDLDHTLARLEETRQRFLSLLATIWEKNSPAVRAEYQRRLTEVPLVRTALDRLAANRGSPKSQPQPPEPNESEKP